MTIVRFWFDPSCPLTWLVSRWMREVEQVRPVRVRWQVMSLSVLNEGRDVDPEGDTEGYLWGPARVFAAVQERYGPDVLGRLYDTFGAMVHDGGGDGWRPMAEVLEAAGLPVELASTVESVEAEQVLRASHAAGVGLVGTHVGTPITAVTGADGATVAWFGPVISVVPRGEAAGRLWDGTLAVAGTDGFHELRGPAYPYQA